MTLDFVTISVLAPIVIAIVQAVKAIPPIARQGGWLSPFLAMAIAAIITAAWYVYQPPPGQVGLAWWGQWAIHSIIIGLTAGGLYSVAGKKVLSVVDKFMSIFAGK